MKKKRFLLFLLFLTIISGSAYPQFDPGKICHLDGDKLVFRLERNWNDSERTEVSRLFDLDSLLFIKAFEGLPFIEIDSITWQVQQVKDGIVEVSKFLIPSPPQFEDFNQYIIRENKWTVQPPVFDRLVNQYGVNVFHDIRAFQMEGDTATFFLPGYGKSRKIFISGSFNGWSTMHSPMVKTDSGWIFRISLLPGKYSYKYIVDGKWMPDPNNKQKEDDTYNSYNSIVYSYNYQFILKGFPLAKKVYLSGSFNDWQERELRMNYRENQWEIPLFLKAGTHSYKYIVDGTWITDPGNPLSRPDGKGNINSVIAIGDTTFFHLNGFLSAAKVYLAGNFNGWNPGELEMVKDDTGWMLPYVLAAGNYEYKFVVDGKWLNDPSNLVSMGPEGNSLVSVHPNYQFELKGFPDAQRIVLAGSFNGWNPDFFRMEHAGGKWIFRLYLAPGKHTYKFIVDGNWIIDPANELWEENEYGTNNSVIWIQP